MDGYLIIAKYFTHSAIKYNQVLIYFPNNYKTKNTWLKRFYILSQDISRKWADFRAETFLNINACELHGQQSFARKGEAEVSWNPPVETVNFWPTLNGEVLASKIFRFSGEFLLLYLYKCLVLEFCLLYKYNKMENETKQNTLS